MEISYLYVQKLENTYASIGFEDRRIGNDSQGARSRRLPSPNHGDGFVRGQRVEVLLNAPLKDPIEYKVMGYDISLRRSEADMVEVLSDSEAKQLADEQARQVVDDASGRAPKGDALPETGSVERVIHERSRHIEIALVGNPNSGKTSLFNAISGGHEHVGNYSGVTVDAKRGRCTYRGYTFGVTDLPGTYALSAYTPEERYVRSHIEKNNPDVIVNAVVASNLERNLYLTTELIDINPRIVVALNMYDELDASGATLDYDSLGRMLGVPMVPVEARNHKGIETLLDLAGFDRLLERADLVITGDCGLREP